MTKWVSLFSGIDGFRQAFNKIGFDCVMSSEIDKWANKAHEVVYGYETVGDVTKIHETDVPDHDLLVGGFPCQAFSVAGKRRGFDEARGTLFFEIARIAKEKQPKVVLMENVKGLVNHDKGNTLRVILETMSDIGYRVDFEVLNSKHFNLPQNRERVFIVAVRDDLVDFDHWDIKNNLMVGKAKRKYAEMNTISTFNFSFPSNNEVTTVLRDILEDDVDERYYLDESKTAGLVAKLSEEGIAVREATQAGFKLAEEGDAVNISFPNSTTRRGRVGKQIAQTLEASDINQGVVVRGMLNMKGNECVRRVYDVAGMAPTLTTMGGGHREPKVVVQQFSNGNGISYCVDANYHKGISEGSVGKGRRTHIMESYRIRKLTPKECFRLQGFDDSIVDKLVEAGISNTQLYKMSGNAVSVNVISALAEKLYKYLEVK